MSDEIDLHDQIAMEIDKRKIQKLIDEGEISAEDVANASIVEVQPTCYCGRGIVYFEGTTPKCPECGKPGTEVAVEL